MNFKGYENVIETASIREQVAKVLRTMIIKGELKGSQQIRERELSELLNVSTTPVKEALRLLQAEGLVYTKPRSGTYVSDFSVEIMLQVMYMRSALDGIAAYFACKVATDEEICEIGRLVEEMRRLTEERADPSLLSRKNEQFHEEIRSSTQNDYLINLIHNMREIDQIFRELALNGEEIERDRSFADHEAIYRAISRREAEEAERLMNIHIRRVADYVSERFQKSGKIERKE